MKETKLLSVKLTPEEMDAVVAKHSDEASAIKSIEDRKRSSLADFRHEKKPHVDELARLDEIKQTGCETRKVECEWRDGLVNGVRELVRLDTMEVIDTASDDPEEAAPDSAQPALPFAAPPPPVLRWTGFDADGVAHSITAEQFDAAEREIEKTGSAVVFVGENSDQRVTLKNVTRARACETCGAADSNHRPECAGMKAEALLDEALGDAIGWCVGDEVRLKSGGPVMKVVAVDGDDVACEWVNGDAADREVFTPAMLITASKGHDAERIDAAQGIAPDATEGFDDPNDTAAIAETYDRSDSKQVAAEISKTPPPNDRPLPSAADATRKVTPKRKRSTFDPKADAAEGNGAE